MKDKIITENFNSFVHGRKQVCLCNLSNYHKITVYGPSAVNLINKLSIRDISKISDLSFFTIFLKRKRFIDEVQIIKLSPFKYLIITKNLKKVQKSLYVCKRKFPLVTIENSTNQYAFFSFHGAKMHEYFEKNKSSNLYKITQQSYTYYTLLTSNINKFSVADHFKNLGFFEISIESHNLFLYNNSVISNLEKIKYKYRLNTYVALYKADNFSFKTKFKIYCVKQYEVTKNIITYFGMKILNEKHRCVGYVHNFYRLPNKKNPNVLAIVRKYQADKIALLKDKKEKYLVKEYFEL